MADVTEMRGRRPRAPKPDPLPGDRRGVGRGKQKAGEEVNPPLWRWFSAQSAHSDQARREAAVHVKGRWDLPHKPFGLIYRALAAEDSVHLNPFLQLLEEYRVAYNISEDDDEFARNVGTAGMLIPSYIEVCEECNRDAIPGTGKCGRHGGAWISQKDAADLSRRIHDRLLTASERAVRVLEDLMDNGRSEIVRSTAAAQVLDRAGIGPHMNVNHTGEITITSSDQAAEDLRVRLDRLRQNVLEREQQAALEAAAAQGDILDAVVVSETA